MAIPIDLVPAAHGVVVLAARPVAGTSDNVITRDIPWRIIAFIDPSAPPAGADAILVSLRLECLPDQM